MSGSEEQTPAMSTYDLVSLIKKVGKHPIERDTLYNIVQDYNEVEFDEDKLYKGYLSLPVVNN
jgi:aminodeoxyfutalosine synthase